MNQVELPRRTWDRISSESEDVARAARARLAQRKAELKARRATEGPWARLKAYVRAKLGL